MEANRIILCLPIKATLDFTILIFALTVLAKRNYNTYSLLYFIVTVKYHSMHKIVHVECYHFNPWNKKVEQEEFMEHFTSSVKKMFFFVSHWITFGHHLSYHVQVIACLFLLVGGEIENLILEKVWRKRTDSYLPTQLKCLQ